MLTSRELVIVLGLVIYVTTLLVASLFVTGSKVSLAIVLGIGLFFGHLLVFLGGYTRFFRATSNIRTSEVVFFVGFQLLLLAQDLVPLRLLSLDHRNVPVNSMYQSPKKPSSLIAFQVLYSLLLVLGGLMVTGSVRYLDFCPPEALHARTFNKLMKYGLLVGIVGSAMYSLADTAGWHYTGTSLIVLSMILCGIGFVTPRMSRKNLGTRDIESYGSVN